MNVLVFIRELFRKYSFLLASNIVLLVTESLIGIASLFTIAPIIDFFIYPDLQNSGPITRKAVSVLGTIGLPVTLTSFLAVFLSFQLLKNGFMIFARHCILRTKYAVLRDLMVGTFEDFFYARWLFFSSSSQGMILNTFVRELTVVGNAFGAMALFFAALLQLTFYLLVDRPEVYGLPSAPKEPRKSLAGSSWRAIVAAAWVGLEALVSFRTRRVHEGDRTAASSS